MKDRWKEEGKARRTRRRRWESMAAIDAGDFPLHSDGFRAFVWFLLFVI